MRMYLRILANTFRPSMTPPLSTMRSFSNRIRSADSLAISAAVSTEMPISAASNAGEERCLLRRISQFGVGHFLDIIAQQHRVGDESHVLAHLAADEIVVACEDLYHYTMFVQRLDRGGRCALGRVEKCDIPFQHQIVLVLLRAGELSRQFFDGDRQNPESIITEARILVLQPLHQGGIHGRKLAIQIELGTLVKYFFRSAFGQKDRLAFRTLDEYGHHAPRKVERNLVQLLILLDKRLLVKIGTIQNRGVKQVLQACLEMTDEVAVPEYFIRFTTGNITVTLKDNPIFGERAGLIGA